MTEPVAQHTRAEFPERTPRQRVVGFVEGNFRSLIEPQIEVEAFRRRILRKRPNTGLYKVWSAFTLPPARAAAHNVDFAHAARNAGVIPFFEHSNLLGRVPLIHHLGFEVRIVFFRLFKLAALPNIVHKGLLNTDVLARRHTV